jgi:hypothetical protein
MDPTFIRNNLVLIAITIFIVLYTIIHSLQPGFLYNKDGTLRQFGVGRRLATVVPSWLVAILLGIFSYVIALQLLRLSRRRVF